MTSPTKPIVIFGAGAYGTALALNFHLSHKNVILLPRRIQHADDLITVKENKNYLPNVPLGDLQVAKKYDVLATASAILFVIPTKTYTTIIPKIKHYISQDTPVILCSKGLLQDAPFLLSDYISEQIDNPIAIWSGPHFAKEAAKQVPSALTLACKSSTRCANLIKILSTDSMRLYGTTDVISVQIAGALKNVIAIACGIARGLGFGENTIAALITRGLSEIQRLAIAMGGDGGTLLGLSGVGDLTLTCSSLNSRNTALGLAIAGGEKAKDILSSQASIAEGFYTAKAAYQLKEKYNVRMPILAFVYDILYQNSNLKSALKKLLSYQETWENA